MFAPQGKTKSPIAKQPAPQARPAEPALNQTSHQIAIQLFPLSATSAGPQAAAGTDPTEGAGNPSERSGTTAASGGPISSAGTATQSPSPQSDSANAAPFGIIVEDGLPLGPGQVYRTQFMATLSAEIERVANEELAATGRTAQDCPYLIHWLRFYRERPAAHIERAIQQYARPERIDLASVLEAVAARVRTAVLAWIRSGGRDVQAPEGVGLLGADDGVTSPSPTPTSGGAIQRKATETADGNLSHAPSAGDPAAVRAQLRNGQPLEGGLRTRMERGFGGSFGDVRLHTDSTAARLTRSFSARAFTIGQDIAFGPGQFRPGTLSGDFLLAHELSHVVQQGPSGASSKDDQVHHSVAEGGSARSTELELEADRGAMAAILRSSNSHDASLEQLTGLPADQLRLHAEQHALVTPQVDGLKLRRCGDDVDFAPPNTVAEAEAEAEDTASEVASPPAIVPSDTEMADLSDVTWEARKDDNRVLMLWSQGDLYLLPAKGLVFTPKPTAGKQAQKTGPALGIPAAGHAGTYLVKTSKGVGMLVDAAGQRQGSPNVLLPISMANLQSRMGIKTIDGCLISHTHADHVANVPMLIEREQLKGNIYTWPGWEGAKTGPLAKVWEKLREASFTKYGKGPGWQPTKVPAQQVPGPAGATGVTRGSMTIGTATLEFVTPTEKLQQYNKALAEGKSGTQFADAASKLVRITQAGADFATLIVGDLRGQDLKELHGQMGEEKFKEFVRGTQILGGIQHHLGAVNSKADVEGIRLLLKAIGPTAEPLTAVVQTDKGRNMELVKSLTESGVRVVALGEIDPTKPESVTITGKGKVLAKGASIYEPAELTAQANRRAFEMIKATEALEKYPDQLVGIGKTPAEIAEGLKTETKRLREAIERRQELATSKLHKSTAVPNLEQELQKNEVEMKKVAGAEAELGRESIGRLARYSTLAAQIKTETEISRIKGEATERLRKLIAEVEGKRASEILAEEMGSGAMSKRAARRARNRAISRLQSQVRTQRMLQTGSAPISPGGRGVAVLMLAIEVVRLAEPFVTDYIKEKADQKHQDFYLFLRTLLWWQEHGASLPVVALKGDTVLKDPKEMILGAQKRIWQDLPAERQTPEAKLDEDVRSATPVDRMYIPALKDWPQPDLVWDQFRLWVTANVQNFDDYSAQFTDVENPAIRWQGTEWEDAVWQVRTGKIEDGHVVGVWEESKKLTKIMRTTVRRVIDVTGKEISKENARKVSKAPSNYPSIGPAIDKRSDRPSPDATQGGVTGTAHFKEGRKHKVYGHYQLTEPQSPFAFYEANPSFVVYGDHPAPDDYVLVGGADFNTNAPMRKAKIWTYDLEHVVQIQADRTKPYETIPTEPDRTDEEKFALQAVAAGQAKYHTYSGSGETHSIYKGEVRFPYWAPNVWAKFYVKKDDLDFGK